MASAGRREQGPAAGGGVTGCSGRRRGDLVPSDATLSAPAADRTVKRVLNKQEARKTTASPPALVSSVILFERFVGGSGIYEASHAHYMSSMTLESGAGEGHATRPRHHDAFWTTSI